MPKLTKRVVEKLEPLPGRDLVFWDSELPGFGVRVWPSGKRAYILKYRTREGRQRKETIGPHGRITAERARAEALRVLGEARLGHDPARARLEGRRAPTIADLAQRYLQEHAPKKRPASAAGDETLLRRHIPPAAGLDEGFCHRTPRHRPPAPRPKGSARRR